MRWERGLPLVVSFAVTAMVDACTSSPPAVAVDVAAETECSKGAAFQAGRLYGSSLPPHTLALTFDDGPSERTLELASYLAAQGIAAAFFVNGMRVLERPQVLPQVVAHGHVIGNHTQEHRDLTDVLLFPATPAGDDALVASVALTDALVAPFLQNGRRLFRAPYGAWNARAFAVLQPSSMGAYVGPIDWDIGDHRSATTGADWACWQTAPALTTKECGDLFLAQITTVDRGIVLMHDAAYGNEPNHALTAGTGNTIDMVKYLVPLLKTAGFTFVRVDHVPAIAAQLPPLPTPDGGAADASEDGGDGDADASDASPDGASPGADAAPDAAAVPTPAPARSPDPCAGVTRARTDDAH